MVLSPKLSGERYNLHHLNDCNLILYFLSYPIFSDLIVSLSYLTITFSSPILPFPIKGYLILRRCYIKFSQALHIVLSYLILSSTGVTLHCPKPCTWPWVEPRLVPLVQEKLRLPKTWVAVLENTLLCSTAPIRWTIVVWVVSTRYASFLRVRRNLCKYVHGIA